MIPATPTTRILTLARSAKLRHEHLRNFRTSQFPGGSKQLRSTLWFCLSTRVQHCSAWRRRSLLWHERRHQLPVRRTAFRENDTYFFTKDNFDHQFACLGTFADATNLYQPVPRRPGAAPGNQIRGSGALGIRQFKRPGHSNRTQCRDLPMEPRHSAHVSRRNRHRCGLFSQPQHAPALGGRCGSPLASEIFFPRQLAMRWSPH